MKHRELSAALDRFTRFAEGLPSSMLVEFPWGSGPQQVAAPGQLGLLLFRTLQELTAWAKVLRNLPAYKLIQLVRGYHDNLRAGSYLMAAMAARAAMETAALANDECNEVLGKSSAVFAIATPEIKALKKHPESLKEILAPILEMRSLLRLMVQRSRTDWLSLMDPSTPKETADKIRKQLSQTNVLTALGRLSFPPTTLATSARDQYELICDFVHPNRGSHALFVKRTENSGGRGLYLYAKDPACSELEEMLLLVTSAPLQQSLRLVETVHERWAPLQDHLSKLTGASRAYA